MAKQTDVEFSIGANDDQLRKDTADIQKDMQKWADGIQKELGNVGDAIWDWAANLDLEEIELIFNSDNALESIGLISAQINKATKDAGGLVGEFGKLAGVAGTAAGFASEIYKAVVAATEATSGLNDQLSETNRLEKERLELAGKRIKDLAKSGTQEEIAQELENLESRRRREEGALNKERETVAGTIGETSFEKFMLAYSTGNFSGLAALGQENPAIARRNIAREQLELTNKQIERLTDKSVKLQEKMLKALEAQSKKTPAGMR